MGGRSSSPVHTIQHELLKCGGLKAPPIMPEQKHKDLAVTVLARPPQGKGTTGHGLGLPLRTPGMGALRRIRGDKDVITRGEGQTHVQFIGGLEVRHAPDARMAGRTHVDGELAVGWMETRSGDPSPAGDLVIGRPGLGQTRGDVQTDKRLACTDEILQAVLFGRRQGQVWHLRESFPARIEDHGIVSRQVCGPGQDRGIFGDGHLMTGLAQKIAQDRGGFVIRVPASR